jgi:hypothetical protein
MRRRKFSQDRRGTSLAISPDRGHLDESEGGAPMEKRHGGTDKAQDKKGEGTKQKPGHAGQEKSPAEHGGKR